MLNDDKRQTTIFDLCATNHGGNEQSAQAFESIKDRAEHVRRQILAFIQSRGPQGATCEEIEVALGLKHQTASARCAELKGVPGVAKYPQLVLERGKRPTSSGRAAAVLVAAQIARSWVDE